MTHETYMRRCLQLAKIGLQAASPNPSVGAVLVSNDQIIGEGYTSPYGGPHGELNCINDCKRRMGQIPPNTTLYVSLEPCSHFGKTPPCSDLIIKENIHTVVIACTDSNPAVAGRGIKKLQNAGIKVINNILEKEARELNRSFFLFHEKKRPLITLKWAQSTDGYFAPSLDKQFWITNQKSKQFVHNLRRNHMAILIGQKTAEVDNPQLTTRLVSGENPLRIILLGDHQIAANRHLLTDNEPTLVFTFKKMELQRPKACIVLDKNRAILPQVLDNLYQRNILSLMIEGGAYTLQQFIASDLWDEALVLTGQNDLSEGKPAPKFDGQLIDAFDFFGDKVKYYKNTKNDLVTA